MEKKNIIYDKTQNNIIYDKTKNNNIRPIDTSHKDFAMNAAQAKKEMLERMKQEALDAAQRSEEFHQRMRDDDMLRDIPITDIPEGYGINQFGEIERPGKSR